MRYICLLLAVFTFFVGRMVIYRTDRSLGLRTLESELTVTRGQLQFVSERLHDHRRSSGRYPTNDEGLLSVRWFGKNISKSRFLRRSREDQRAEWLGITSAGVLTLWGEPFIYENRRGLSQSDFEPLDQGIRDGYAIRVDDGVYVWSVAARDTAHIYRSNCVTMQVTQAIAWAMPAVLMLLYIRLTIRRFGGHSRRGRGISIVMALVGESAITILLGAALLPIREATCYTATMIHMRSRKLTSQYTAVLDRYHDKGIISDSAYKKITEAMKEPY